eukprot:TRINITY_DN5662_c0_g1_i8.p1 TRINITY_DN5662_c0_g1~~TRINITY_DN5662_c0_g1_i8.p1  ORF type:complete len:650 (-),score=133.29 TRINITY_DN5662_c0_g1_i8:12-1961(-)
MHRDEGDSEGLPLLTQARLAKRKSRVLALARICLMYLPLIGTLFPFLAPKTSTSSPYSYRAGLRSDIIAGITVGVMIVPQGLAYSILCGLPPIYGLYSSLLPPLMYGLMGSSRQLSVGPVAVVSILTAEGLASMDPDGLWSVEEKVAHAIALAMLVGLLTFACGVFRLGFIETVLSRPVTSGYLTAVAIIIASSQLGSLLGLKGLSTHGSPLVTLYSIIRHMHETNPTSAVMASVAIVIMMGVKAFKMWVARGKGGWRTGPGGTIVRLFPDMLLVIVASILITRYYDLNTVHGVQILGDIPSGLPVPYLPAETVWSLGMLLPTAASITLVGFVESVSVAKAMATRSGEKLNPNQELLGLGAANIVGALFQSFPVSASPPRSAVNDLAGASSGLASVMCSVFVGCALLFFSPLGVFYYLPLPVMASVIIVALWELVDVHEPVFLWRIRHLPDMAQLLATFALTIILGAGEGVLIIVIISVTIILNRSSNVEFNLTRGKSDKEALEAQYFTPDISPVSAPKQAASEPQPKETLSSRHRILSIQSGLYFANASTAKEIIIDLERTDHPASPEGLVIILDLTVMNTIDSTTIHVLLETDAYMSARDVPLIIITSNQKVIGMLNRAGFSPDTHPPTIFYSVREYLYMMDSPRIE